jgi:hypothetical protein
LDGGVGGLVNHLKLAGFCWHIIKTTLTLACLNKIEYIYIYILLNNAAENQGLDSLTGQDSINSNRSTVFASYNLTGFVAP